MEIYHIPVLLKEAIKGLNIQIGKKYIDATLGGGGHSFEIIKNGGNLLAFDCDNDAINYASKRLEKAFPLKEQACPQGVCLPAGRWQLVKSNFANIEEVARTNNFFPVNGILFDLGVSSFQLETPEKGFSFNKEGPLDMRMDKTLAVCAADLINGLTENELITLFQKFGEEFHSRSIAHAIVNIRNVTPIKTTQDLVKLILRVAGKRTSGDRSHPATRIFQALRICVNDELNSLKSALPQALNLLDKNGRLVVISFHSLEDRIVKNFFKDNQDKLKIITKKPIEPTEEEVIINPRSRSAKLRIAEKT